MRKTLRNLTVLLFSILTPLSASAQSLPDAGDYYMISRNANGGFHASRQILSAEHDEYQQVVYCDMYFWVKPEDVYWTERQAEIGRVVRIERNTRSQLEPVCAEPHEQVKLADLGLGKVAESFIRREGTQQTSQSRMRVIRDAFSIGN